MASVVSIQIRVDDAGATDALQRIEQALTSTGVQGSASIKKAGEQLEKLGGHTTTSLDQIRLLSQEFGLRLPRAMEAALSRMPALTAAVGSFAGGILAIGAAEVFVRMGTAIYDAEQKYISITASANKFYETLKKTAELDFTNTRDLATTQRRMDEAQANYNTAPGLAKTTQSGGLQSLLLGTLSGNGLEAASGIGAMFGAKSIADSGATSGQQVLDLSRREIDQAHDKVLAQIELNHAMDSTLQKRQQIAAETQKEQAISAENRLYGRKVQMFYGNPTPLSAGADEQQQKDAVAQAQAASKTIELNNEVSSAIIRARNAATEAGMQGEALYAQKEKDAIEEVKAELRAQHLAEEIPERVKALNKQYDNDRLERLRSLTEEAQRMSAAAAAAGLTGASKILADRDTALDDIDERHTKASGGAKLSPEQEKQFDIERAAARTAANQKLVELEASFSEHVNVLVDQRAQASLNGYAKIDAAATKQVAELRKTYDQDFANAKLSDDQKLQAERNLQAGIAAIEGSAAQQKQELTLRNQAQDLQYDREAAQAEMKVRTQGIGGWTGAYKNAIAEIQAAEDQRLADLKRDANRESLTDQEVAKRRVDIERSANAEIEAQQQQMQHQIAGMLQQAFTNPVEFIKSQMEKMFFEIVAGWIMRTNLFKSFFGQAMGGLQPGGAAAGGGAIGAAGAGGGVSSILGAVMSGRAPSGTAGVIPGGATLPAGYNASNFTSAGTNFSTSSTPIGASGGSSGGGLSIGTVAGDMMQLGGRLNIPGLGGTPTGSGGGIAGASSTTSAGAGAGASGAAGAAMGVGSDALMAYSGGKTVYDSFFQTGAKGALNSTLGGAEAGAGIGMLVGGPAGALLGAGIGAAAGLAINVDGQVTGEAGRIEAREYYRKTIFPELEKLRNQANPNGSDADTNYMDAMSQVDKIAAQGTYYLQNKYGMSATNWVKANYLNKEVALVDGQLIMRARSGSNYLSMGAKEFHDGGTISGFGDFATSSTEGFVHAKVGEGIVMDRAMQQHGAMVHAMNSGADATQMAGMYLAAAGGRGGSSGDTHYHQHNYNAIDAKSFKQFLDGGGIKTVQDSLNRRASIYAGDAASG